MNPILGLFNLFALFYVFRGLQLSLTIWRERSDWQQEPLTPRKKWLAEQASFFIAVPIGVFLHELGHAVAVWLFGGQVVEFGYRVFWGYVVPLGEFTAVQHWFISFAGTFGSLLYGLALWLLLRGNPLSSLRYFGLRAFRFQVYFALIYYPIFTLFTQVGDWRTIYSFNLTPLLSGGFVVIHALILFAFWRGDKQGDFDMPAHPSTADAQQFRALSQTVTAEPHNIQAQVQYVDALRRGTATNKARHYLQKLIAQNPNVGLYYLELALLHSQERLTRQTSQYAEKALQLGLDNPVSSAYAHQLVGQYQLNVEKYDQAAVHFEQAIALLSSQPAQVKTQAQLYHLRSQAYRHQGQYEHAYQDMQQAIKLAQTTADPDLVEFYQQETAVIEKHHGRSLNMPSTGTYPQSRR